MRVFSSADEIVGAAGEKLGVSEWVEITQERIDTFAEATGDHQWIHVDVERATSESPYGKPIAHGYLTLSLLPMLGWQIYRIEGSKMGINYGSNKVRFVKPVPVGSRVRLHSTLVSAESLPNGSVQMIVGQSMEIEGQEKPALVAETVSRVAF
ncbi:MULTISPECIES: MaoC family dehydratase [unclassified Rhodococcus (in: high G+C Gram-positive bacteria)]|uniref:MaoC family dehydratase n=1 Tax=unclassified Rhodococcus (in: high G+C Gram-positive bacteria) TaxID=192944 RepID=UPI000925DBD3|nr:MaoC family dehydratase [Rhodococcus sp. M8]OLL21479.1 enoyl-CoA hydratase [Rhodococcus sp. M8]QPG44128.1 MaoC family dehydratase [Rhodococcus sp. M8]